MDKFLEFVLEKILIPFLALAALVAIFVFIPMMVYSIVTQQKSPKFELYKDEWVCTETAEKKKNVLIGKTLQVMTDNVCINYSMKKD